MYLDFNTFKQDYLNLSEFKLVDDNNLFYLWKNGDIPSTFGKQKSVLDLLELEFFDDRFVRNQKTNFTKQQEFGLLNRLDNSTSGFLYFAKNIDIYKQFKSLQSDDKIKKIYYAKVSGYLSGSKEISYPIMHKNRTKMISIKTKKDIKKGRGKLHFVKTLIESIEYNKKDNTTWLKVIITKGIRHQIRNHLASIGFPIVGDKLYGGKNSINLYLFSVGIDL